MFQLVDISGSGIELDAEGYSEDKLGPVLLLRNLQVGGRNSYLPGNRIARTGQCAWRITS